MKSGERIKVVRTDEYSEQVRKAQYIKSPIGMTGTVVEVKYNPNMGRVEVFARMDGVDGPNSCHLWNENEVETIK